MKEGTDRGITTEEMEKDWKKDPLESTVEGNMSQVIVVDKIGRDRAAIERESTEIGTDREGIDQYTQLILRFT
jgi:hypothetical protein